MGHTVQFSVLFISLEPIYFFWQKTSLKRFQNQKVKGKLKSVSLFVVQSVAGTM